MRRDINGRTHNSRGWYESTWTPERDATLRGLYDGRKGCINACSRALGISRTSVHRRARRLGLTRRASSLFWTKEQLAFLEAHAGEKSSTWIAQRLGKTVPAVKQKCISMAISLRVKEGYTRDSLAECFGVSSETVTRWVERGLLRVEGWKSGAPWRVSEVEIKRFIRRNPTAFRLNRVDQTWFLDLVLGINSQVAA